MPERARTDLWEPQGSNPLGPPGPELLSVPGTPCPRNSLSPELPWNSPVPETPREGISWYEAKAAIVREAVVAYRSKPLHGLNATA